MEEAGEHARGLNRGDLDEATLELADVAFVAMGSLATLGAAGERACHEVARKNDGKTNETHFVEESSGKIVRRRDDE